MSISSISGNNYNNIYAALSSGRRINSAADDAAGLAIAKKLESQSGGLNVGADNAAAGRDMLNVADGALSSITDSLQRIRELGVQASNATYSNSDRAAMQKEVDQLKKSISDTASQTSFNTMNLLDGSRNSWNIAVNSNGDGTKIDTPDSTLKALGIADFDLTKNFDLNKIDKAIDKVSSMRGNMGAKSNALNSVVSYNQYASYNTTATRSRIEDTDYPQAVTEKKKQEMLMKYRLVMQRKMIENEDGRVTRLFGGL